MKFKFAIFVILASTFSLIGLMYAMVNHTGIEATKSDTKDAKPKIIDKNKNSTSTKNFINPNNLPNKMINESTFDNEDIDEEVDNNYSISQQDKQIIEAISTMSQNELVAELNSLKEKIEKNDLVSLLESGTLDEVKSNEAKATLERFALLGLEGTRRKYALLEPELKDPLFAHRDSLRDIREMLSEY